MRNIGKRCLAILAALAVICALAIPTLAESTQAAYPEATTLNLADNKVVVLEKDGYTYGAGEKAAANGSYTVAGDVARVLADGDTTPIVVSGGGDVYLTLNAVAYSLAVNGAAPVGFIEITGNTTLHLSWVGANSVVTTGAGSTLAPAIKVDGGSALIMDGGIAETDALTIDTSKNFGTPAIGVGKGASGALIKGGQVTLNSGVLNVKGGVQACVIGGAEFGYLEKITVNGGTINAVGTGAHTPFLGVGRNCGNTDAVIEINGGAINGEQLSGNNFGWGAMIGGAGNASAKSIVINDGDIDLYWNLDTSAGTGNAAVGIGVGSNQQAPDASITINGGDIRINMNGPYHGTAIGAAQGGNVGTITINGGYINAVAKGQSAAIGGSRNMVGNTKIYINGGVIDASVSGIGAGNQIIGASGTGKGAAKVWIAPAASVKAVNGDVVSVEAYAENDAALACVAVQMPEEVKIGDTISVNGTNVKIAAAHADDAGNYYFYLPAGAESNLSYVSASSDYKLAVTASADAVVKKVAADWTSSPVHVHEWSDATCTKPQTCACGETQGEPTGHTWADATCTAPKTCSVCKATEGEPAGHTPSEWKSDARSHWKNCTVEGCGVVVKGTKAVHVDEDKNGKCDVCNADVAISDDSDKESVGPEYPAATELNVSDNKVVVLEKDGYTYDGGEKNAANGSYKVAGDVYRATSYTPGEDSEDDPIVGDETPIVVAGGGDVYLELDTVYYDLFCREKDQIGFITITDNTTLHLTWKGENMLAVSGNSSALDAMIEVEDGSTVILEGYTGSADMLTINVSESWNTACIGASIGVDGNVTKGGTVIVETGSMTLLGGVQANCIGGTKQAYLQKIVINGGDIYGEGRQAASPVIGVGRDCGATDCVIEINGGNIEAMQRNGTNFGFCAIIGGAGKSSVASITINGGTIKAYVQAGTKEVYGANGVCGIGGGQDIAGGTVTINGGDIYIDVSPAYHGTGIGAAQGGSVESITINGGKIVAIGKGIGTAIGGSRNGVGDTQITINGGVIDAAVVAGSNDIIGSAGGAGAVKVSIAPDASVKCVYTSMPLVMSIEVEDADGNPLYATAVKMPEDFTADTKLKINGKEVVLGAAHTYFASIYEMTSMDEDTLAEVEANWGNEDEYYYFYLPEDTEVELSFTENGKKYTTKFTVCEPVEDDDLNLILQSIEETAWSVETVVVEDPDDNNQPGSGDVSGDADKPGSDNTTVPSTGDSAPIVAVLLVLLALVATVITKARKVR